MARKKSYYDLFNQSNRVKDGIMKQIRENHRGGTRERYETLKKRLQRVNDSTERYTRNIMGTQSYLQDIRGKNYYDSITNARNRKYTQRIYMGNAIG